MLNYNCLFNNVLAQVNTFQSVLATDGTATYVMFLYEDIQWGAFRTTIGFNAGDSLQFFNLPEASDVFSLVNYSNIEIPGTFIFRVDQAGKPRVS